MRVVHSVDEVRAERWRDPALTWGLVPTMGALHAGHLSLVERALAENDRVSVSIFVNPTQFGPNEDLDAYPRTLEADTGLLREMGVHLVWTPAPDEVYPPGFQTQVNVTEVARPLEGASRPGHFEGVATVVAKLFNVFQPTRAYFGQKDAQQVAVVKRMVRDLNFNLEVVACPTVREADGLALSSRNRYLNPQERQAATVLSRALNEARNLWESGTRDGEKLRAAMQDILAQEPLARVDYVSAADPVTLQELGNDGGQSMLFSMAVFVGTTRLIDNILIES